MKLNGVMLSELDLISFCDMRNRSYLTSQPRRCVTPPVSVLSSSSSPIITDTSLSPPNVWTTWNTSPEDINVVDYPSSIDPSRSAFDPWTVNGQDIQDNIRDSIQDNIKDNGKSSTEAS
jgi:hypothetical protein